MSKANKGLFLSERICFILAAVVFFVSTFMPLFAYKLNGSVATVSYAGAVGGIAYLLSILVFLIGFAFVVFGGKKHFLLASALSLTSPLVAIGILCANIASFSSSSTAYKINIGGILLFVSAGLYLAAYILHAIGALLSDEMSSAAVDRRIEAVKTYKQYLSEGLIDEQEYEIKKNEILGLSKKEKK